MATPFVGTCPVSFCSFQPADIEELSTHCELIHGMSNELAQQRYFENRLHQFLEQARVLHSQIGASNLRGVEEFSPGSRVYLQQYLFGEKKSSANKKPLPIREYTIVSVANKQLRVKSTDFGADKQKQPVKWVRPGLRLMVQNVIWGTGPSEPWWPVVGPKTGTMAPDCRVLTVPEIRDLAQRWLVRGRTGIAHLRFGLTPLLALLHKKVGTSERIIRMIMECFIPQQGMSQCIEAVKAASTRLRFIYKTRETRDGERERKRKQKQKQNKNKKLKL